MKIKLSVKEENYNSYKKELENLGIEISDNSDLILYENDSSLTSLVGKKDDYYTHINVNDVIYIESYGHDVYIKTINGDYKIKENLKYLMTNLSDDFIRVNLSTIISCNKIKKVKPLLGMRFKLQMVNDQEVFVNRTYYYTFVDKFNI